MEIALTLVDETIALFHILSSYLLSCLLSFDTRHARYREKIFIMKVSIIFLAVLASANTALSIVVRPIDEVIVIAGSTSDTYWRVCGGMVDFKI